MTDTDIEQRGGVLLAAWLLTGTKEHTTVKDVVEETGYSDRSARVAMATLAKAGNLEKKTNLLNLRAGIYVRVK
jgi:hypothetical protein